MRFRRSGNGSARLHAWVRWRVSPRFSARWCTGRFLKRALLGLFLASTLVRAQTPQKPRPQKVAAQRANELTLAGLRPGRDTLMRAKQLYKGVSDPLKEQGESSWEDACRARSLILSYDQKQKIETIRVARMQGSTTADCFDKGKPWRTGHGLAINDAATKVVELYGEPDSRSPSTKGGQPLELWYYAFDWAGPDVPQVMEVLCTREQDGQAGRVVEITLAAPSL
jgi:hypothetical protein